MTTLLALSLALNIVVALRWLRRRRQGPDDPQSAAEYKAALSYTVHQLDYFDREAFICAFLDGNTQALDTRFEGWTAFRDRFVAAELDPRA